MDGIARIGIAIDPRLLERFDRLIEQRGYANRSEAFRDLIRDSLVRESTALPSKEVVGTLTLVYDHHHRQLNAKLMELQHQFHHAIISSLHVHLDLDSCLEVLVLRGRSSDVKHIADLLISTKGIKHGQLTVTSADVTSFDARKVG